MTKHKEIIQLPGLEFSHRNIMASCGIAQKNCRQASKRTKELKLSWPLDESMTDIELQRLMLSNQNKVSPNRRMPDYAYIRKELLRMNIHCIFTMQDVSFMHLKELGRLCIKLIKNAPRLRFRLLLC